MPEDQQQNRIQLELSPQAERYARRDAPRDARLMAARGALPLPPIELATVLFALMHDPDAEVKTTARESLEGLPANVMKPVLSGETHPAMLSHLARCLHGDEAASEQIALNPAADDSTVAFLATLPFKRVVDIVSNNQERMLRCHDIVEALGDNPMTGKSVIERILSFLGRSVDEAAEQVSGVLSDEDAEAALRAVLGQDVDSGLRRLIQESEVETATGDDANLAALIQTLSIVQKVKLARLGNKEARSLLIRDRNKVVAVAAVQSPKITDQEIIAIAQSRNVSDEVLRIVATNRQWTRNYQVKLALSTNPKTPQPSAMRFVNFLQDNDLRSIVKSRDVPAAISTHARRILMKKGKL